VAFRRHPSFRNWHDRHAKMDGRAAHQLAPPGGKKDEKVWPNAGSIFCMWDPCPSFARARSQQLSHILSLSFLAWTETGVLVCCALCFRPGKTGCIAPGLLIHPFTNPVKKTTCKMVPVPHGGHVINCSHGPPAAFGKLTMGWSFVLHGLVISSKRWTFVEATAYRLLKNFRPPPRCLHRALDKS
jgi:hypothetical protein